MDKIKSHFGFQASLLGDPTPLLSTLSPLDDYLPRVPTKSFLREWILSRKRRSSEDTAEEVEVGPQDSNQVRISDLR